MTDHSLTKVASRPLFVCVQRYTLQIFLKISYSKSACSVTPFSHWKQVNLTTFEICSLSVTCKQHIYILYTSPSVSVASRRITLSQRSLCDLCSFVFDPALLNDIFEILYAQLACMITRLFARC